MLLPIGVPPSAYRLGGAERIDFLAYDPDRREGLSPEARADSEPSARGTTTVPITSRWPAPVSLRSPSTLEISSRATMRPGGVRSPMTSWLTTITSLPMSITRIGTFEATRRWRAFGFVLGWLASAQSKPVEWQSGDEFEPARKASEKSRE